MYICTWIHEYLYIYMHKKAYILTKKHYIAGGWVVTIWHIFCQKSPISHHKSPIFWQKSHVFHHNGASQPDAQIWPRRRVHSRIRITLNFSRLSLSLSLFPPFVQVNNLIRESTNSDDPKVARAQGVFKELQSVLGSSFDGTASPSSVSFVTHGWVMSRLFKAYQWVMSHKCEWVVSHTYELVMSHMCEWVVSHTCELVMSHTCEWVLCYTYEWYFLTHMNESCVTRRNESCLTHMNESWLIRMNESCLTHTKGVLLHIWMSHVTHMIAGTNIHVCETWLMHRGLLHCKSHITRWMSHVSHIWMRHVTTRHVTHMNVSCHTYESVMSHIWISHVTQMNESCHPSEWVILHVEKEVWHDSFTRVTWLIHTCDMTHSYVW